MNKRCAWCGEPFPVGKHGRKYHPDCARLVKSSQKVESYARQNGGTALICRGCGKEFLSTKAYRQFCPVCKRKPTWR